jgi:hypothetical protein
VTVRARQEYAEAVRARYQHADKAGKGRIVGTIVQFPCRLPRAEHLYGLRRLQLNFFRPVRKLVSKHRIGRKLVKTSLRRIPRPSPIGSGARSRRA